MRSERQGFRALRLAAFRPAFLTKDKDYYQLTGPYVTGWMTQPSRKDVERLKEERLSLAKNDIATCYRGIAFHYFS